VAARRSPELDAAMALWQTVRFDDLDSVEALDTEVVR
jgi:hypothetical protein